MLPNGSVWFNSFSYTFWLSYTINYSNIKSASVLNCTKCNHCIIITVQVARIIIPLKEFRQFRQSRPISRETPTAIQSQSNRSPNQPTPSQKHSPLCNHIKEVKLEPGEVMTSYGVKVLFTSCPMDPSIIIIKQKLQQTHLPHKGPTCPYHK